MLKNILNLNGAQQLNKNEQSEINGGKAVPECSGTCNYFGQHCYKNGHCGCPGQCGYQLGTLTCIPW